MQNPSPPQTQIVNTCKQCTFVNQPGESTCKMCNSSLVILGDDLLKIVNNIEKDIVITDNYIEANNTIPESFFPVKMLYFPCWINGKPIKIFLDTGAQNSIMSRKCAEDYGIAHLIDTRRSGLAVGIGEQKIVGQIWMVELDLGDHILPCSFIILENVSVEIIFGLNMLISHGCVIDCKEKFLRIGGVDLPLIEKD